MRHSGLVQSHYLSQRQGDMNRSGPLTCIGLLCVLGAGLAAACSSQTGNQSAPVQGAGSSSGGGDNSASGGSGGTPSPNANGSSGAPAEPGGTSSGSSSGGSSGGNSAVVDSGTSGQPQGGGSGTGGGSSSGGSSSGPGGNGGGSSSGNGSSSGAGSSGGGSSGGGSSGGAGGSGSGGARDAGHVSGGGSDASVVAPPGCNLAATVSFKTDIQPFLAASCGNGGGGANAGNGGCHVLDATSTTANGGYNHAYDWITGTAHNSSCPETPTPFRFQVVMAVMAQADPPSCSKSRIMPPQSGADVRAPATACQTATMQAWLNEPQVTQTHRSDGISPATPYAMPPFN